MPARGLGLRSVLEFCPLPGSVGPDGDPEEPERLTARRNNEGADHSLMRQLNRSLVLQRIKEQSPISRADLARETSLAKPTVSAIVDELVAEGTVRKIGVGPTTAGGGRPPILLEFDARSQYIVGVQIGVEQTNIVVADARGAELDRDAIPTPDTSPEEALGALARSIRKLLSAAGVPRKRLGAVGVCIPGLVEAHTGVCLLAPNLGWRDVPVSKLLRAALRVPIFVVNTADGAVVLENIDGAAEGAKDVVLLYVGRGVGASVLSDGRLVRGARGLSGEIGHCTIPGATQRCMCGNIGCLETVADGRAIERAARASLAEGRRSLLADRPRRSLTAVDVAAAAAEGDEVALEVLDAAGRALGLGVSWMVNLFNPEVVVIGGGVANSGEPLIGPLREAVFEHALSHNVEGLRIVPWTSGRDAGVSGAVLVALQASESYYRVIFQG